MASHGEVSGYTCLTQSFNHLTKVRRHVLKDQREADDIRFVMANALQDLLGVGTVSHDDCLVA